MTLRQTTILFFCLFCSMTIYSLGVSSFYLFDDKPTLQSYELLHFDHTSVDEWRQLGGSSNTGVFHRPLSVYSFAIERIVFEDWTPAVSKAINIVLHCINGLLVVLGVFYLLGAIFLQVKRPSSFLAWLHQYRFYCALFVGVAWLMLPVHTSTVLYSVQRMTLLASFFVLLGVTNYVYWRYRLLKHGGFDVQSANKMLALLLVYCVLAILSKESGALLLLYVASIEYFVFGVRFNSNLDSILKRTMQMIFCCLIVTLIISLFFTSWWSQLYLYRDFTVYERLFTQSRLLWEYVYWSISPFHGGLTFFHDDTEISSGLFSPFSTLISLAAWLVIAVAVFYPWRYRYLFAACVCWFIFGHSMESSVLPLEMQFEHRNYLPSLGILVLLAITFFYLLWRYKANGLVRLLGIGLGGFFILSITVGGFSRVYEWSDKLRLLESIAEKNPQSYRVRHVLASHQLKIFEQYDKKNPRLLESAIIGFEAAIHLTDQNLPSIISLIYIDQKYYSSRNSDRLFGLLDDRFAGSFISITEANALGTLVTCYVKKVCDKFERRAMNIYLNAIEFQKRKSSFYYYLAKWNFQKGRVMEASKYINLAVANDSDNLTYKFMRTAINSSVGDEKAITQFVVDVFRQRDAFSHTFKLKSMYSQGILVEGAF